MLTANSEGNTDVGNLTGGAALQKDPFSRTTKGKKLKDYIKSLKGKFFQKSSLKISKDDVHPNPSHAQKQAGNYRKAHVRVLGFDIAIENPKGSYRKGTDPNGKEWKCKMHHHYGYFKRTLGKDGDHIDCFIGPNTKSELVFIINQIRPSSGVFDEHKVMLGFDSLEEAKEGYLANYSEGWKGLGEIHPFTLEQFKIWLQKADTTKKAKKVIIKSAFKNYFSKSQKAQVGETRTWSDGKVHRKTENGWVEVTNPNPSRPKPSLPESQSKQNADPQKKSTYEQKAIEAIERWKEFEKEAKARNRERISKAPPEKRNEAFNIRNAVPGDIVRIERPIDGRVNRGHLAKVLDKIDGHLKVMLPSGSIFLFLAADLAFAKSSNGITSFLKGKLAQVGEVRVWSDGNKYRKELNGWRMIGDSDTKAAHQATQTEASKKAGMSKEEHEQATEKAMQNGVKIPVKVLREYPSLLEKYPIYKKRVSAIDSLSKGLKKGSQVGNELEQTANNLRQGKIPNASKALDSLKSGRTNSEVKPIGNGDHGPIYNVDQFDSLKAGIEHLQTQKNGEIIGAIKHPEIDKPIDLIWGNEGSAKSDGYGLAKILKYHPEVINNLAEIIGSLKIKSKTNNRINLESLNHKAAVRLEWDLKDKNWLLTAFEIKGIGSTTDIPDPDSGMTAPR